MRKSYFLALMIFMILSVGGIILIQGYFIYTAVENREEEFSMAVQASLSAVAAEIQEDELLHYIETFENLTDSITTPDSSSMLGNFIFYESDDESNLSSLLTFGILQDDYSIPVPGSNNSDDFVQVSDFKGIQTRRIFKEVFDRENQRTFSREKFERIQRIDALDKATFASFFSNIANTFPIHKRLDSYELENMLSNQFTQHNVSTPFEFVVLSQGLATKVSSNDYLEIQEGPKYNIPIFVNNEGTSTYDLVVSFPEKSRYLLSSIFGVASLSFVLTLLIVILCGISLYQIIQQKKISEIKSDFINNMSHEFKTPIATINLAIDAIENPVNIKDEKKVSRYLQMMREENKRMKDQVETVLMISQLERGSTPVEMKIENVHELIEGAISHVALIVQNRSGMIYKHLEAPTALVRVDKNHLTNVFINLLDNAIKYSEGSPIIEIRTWVENDQIAIEVKDEGMGMDNETLKLIFHKFYRQQGGNIHNIKGHGLGLSYVKRIIDLLNGTIHVKSKMGKGSSFTVQLPLEHT